MIVDCDLSNSDKKSFDCAESREREHRCASGQASSATSNQEHGLIQTKMWKKKSSTFFKNIYIILFSM